MTLRLSKKKRTEFLVTFSSPFFCTIFAAFFTFLSLKTVQKFCGKMDKRNAVIFLLCFTIALKKIYKFHLENFFVRHIILGLFIKNVTNIEKCCFPWKSRQSCLLKKYLYKLCEQHFLTGGIVFDLNPCIGHQKVSKTYFFYRSENISYCMMRCSIIFLNPVQKF